MSETPSFIAPLTAKQMREKLDAHVTYRQETVRVPLPNGETLEVVAREPKRAEQAQMYKAAGMKPSTSGLVVIENMHALNVWAVILCAYTPGGERLYTAADAALLMERPASDPLVDLVGNAVQALCKKAEAAGEASASTP